MSSPDQATPITVFACARAIAKHDWKGQLPVFASIEEALKDESHGNCRLTEYQLIPIKVALEGLDEIELSQDFE